MFVFLLRSIKIHPRRLIMEKVLINGYPCLKGDDPDDFIEKLPYKELTVNDKIVSIGRTNSGMENKLVFLYPALYKGVFVDNNDRYLAIEVDQREILGRDLFNYVTSVCILIAITGETLFLQNFDYAVSKEIKPVFVKHK